MSKRTSIYRFATCGALGLASCVGLTGCGESDYSQYVQDVAFEAESATEDEQQALVDELLLMIKIIAYKCYFHNKIS